MLGSDRIRGKDIRVEFARKSKGYVLRMSKEFPILENYVDARNTLAKRWLKWCGFTIEPPVEYGPEGLPFHLFHMRRG